MSERNNMQKSEQTGSSNSNSNARNGYSGEFFNVVAANLVHAAPTVLYASLGIATVQDLPYIGRLNSVIPVGFFVTNVVARYDETNSLIEDVHERAMHRHKILANYVVNLGLAGTGAFVASMNPTLALPLLGVYTATDVLASGEHSPINMIKDSLSGLLDNVFGDYL